MHKKLFKMFASNLKQAGDFYLTNFFGKKTDLRRQLF